MFWFVLIYSSSSTFNALQTLIFCIPGIEFFIFHRLQDINKIEHIQKFKII